MRRVLFVLLLTACVPDADLTPCTAEGRCLPGYRCIDLRCHPCDGDECPIIHGVGREGGIVCGDGDVCIDVPGSAFETVTPVRVDLAGAVAPVGVVPLSEAYLISPNGALLTMGAKVEVPISSTTAADQISVYRADVLEGPWIRLQGESDNITARGTLDQLGYVVAGHVRTP